MMAIIKANFCSNFLFEAINSAGLLVQLVEAVEKHDEMVAKEVQEENDRNAALELNRYVLLARIPMRIGNYLVNVAQTLYQEAR